MNLYKAILECLALDSVQVDRGIFDIKMFYLIKSVQSNIGMLSIGFGIDI